MAEAGITSPAFVPASIQPGTLGEPQPPTVSMTPSFLQTAKHPTICLLHLGSKLVCLVIFTFGSFLFGGFGGDFVFTFVFSTVLLALDFWIVKNVTGRLLVGMRWSNEVLEDGSNQWRYERATDEQQINSTDKAVFWTALVAWPALWSALAFFYFIQLQWDWMLLTIIGMTLGAANLVGFWKCSSESKRKVQEFASSALFKAFTARASAFFA